MGQTLTTRPGWLRLWAVAVLAHVIGNPRFGQLVGDPTALGVTTAVLALTAGVVLWEPRAGALRGMNVLVVVVAWFEAPIIGNHWLLAAVVALTMLVAETRPDPWHWFAPTARLVLLGFYSWAAFNKLNSGFFDPVESCGVVYADQWLEAVGLPALASRPSIPIVPIIAAAIELSIPTLLVIRRTRTIGVVVASAFHILISFDLAQHFYDFTAVLLPLFVLFLPDGVLEAIDVRVRRDGMRAMAVVATGLAMVSTFPTTRSSVVAVTDGAFVVWAVFVAWYVTWLWSVRRPSGDVRLRPPSPAAWVIVAVVVFNGFTPYLEIKTATAWNMYANSSTADGESNHFVLRRTFPVSDAQHDLATVLGSNDPGLRAYVGSGLAVPEMNLHTYLADRPSVRVTYEVRGEVRTLSGGDAEETGEIQARLRHFRAVDVDGVQRCRLAWLPAG